MRGQIAYRTATHPVFLASLGMLVLNDHFLKAAYPGLVTGKVSDVAGLIVFPLMIISVVDLSPGPTASTGTVCRCGCARAHGRRVRSDPAVFGGC